MITQTTEARLNPVTSIPVTPLGEWILKTVAAQENGHRIIHAAMEEDRLTQPLTNNIRDGYWAQIVWREPSIRADATLYCGQGVTLTDASIYIKETDVMYIARRKRIEAGGTFEEITGFDGVAGTRFTVGSNDWIKRYDDGETRYDIIQKSPRSLLEILDEIGIAS